MALGVQQACVWLSVLRFTIYVTYLSLSFLICNGMAGIKKKNPYHRAAVLTQLNETINISKVFWMEHAFHKCMHEGL